MSESETTPFAPTPHSPTGNPAASDLLVIEPRPLPRLGISHFLLWMLCTSLYLTATRQSLEGLSAQWETQDEITVALQVRLILRYAWLILTGCEIGAAWAGTSVLLFTRIRGGAPLLRQPGHWILLVVGMEAGISLLISFLWGISYIRSGETARLFMRSCGLFLPLAVAALYAIAAWRSRFRRWAAFFAAMVMEPILLAYTLVRVWFHQMQWWAMVNWNWNWARRGYTTIFVISAVVLAAAIVLDIRDRQNRDWLHWLGVATFGISAISTVVGIVHAMFAL